MADMVSPLAPARFPDLPVIDGVRLASAHCGIRYQGRTDLMVALLDPGTTVGGVFTRSLTPGAPVDWCRKALSRGKARAIVVNSGNANVFTGKAGRDAVDATVKRAAKALGCDPREVYVSSTGVIGEKLPAEKIVAALPAAFKAVDDTKWPEAARAIMTTDTFPKGATRTATIDGVTVTINGFAKGSGMIAPNMGTMLGYIFTDATLPAAVLQALLVAGNERAFNSITVDGDTSTSDTVLLCATGKAKHKRVTRTADPRLKDFRRALDAVLIDLAQQIVRDGEGAQKFVTVKVSGAASIKAARKIGLAIGNSPLVKTALAAGDANWGRIVMAVGKAGEKADRDRLAISVGGVRIAEKGGAVEGYDEAPVAKHMAGQDIVIEVDIGIGKGRAEIWTCDLTHRYIDINGSYRADPLPIVPIVSVALIDGQGRVLLQQRPRGKAMEGLWEFPGGKIQAGETPEEALCRELQEELGITVVPSDLSEFGFASHRYDTFHILLLLWTCKQWQGTPAAREKQVLAWTAPAQMSDYPMPAADAPLVTLLQQRL